MAHLHVYDDIHTRFEGRDDQKDFDYKNTVTGVSSPVIFSIQIVHLVCGIIVALLTLRFFLMLLAANEANSFASFIFTISKPFVWPFLWLFSDYPLYGIANIEIESLIAIVFYLVLAWVIVRLLSLLY